jgi:hypothetical protein
MTTAALLLREVETMPEESAVQVLDFARFLRNKQTQAGLHENRRFSSDRKNKEYNRIAIKDAYGIFKALKGMDTTIEREDDDRI